MEIVDIMPYKIIYSSFSLSLREIGRRRSRWEDNIKMDIQELGRGMDWIELAEDRDR